MGLRPRELSLRAMFLRAFEKEKRSTRWGFVVSGRIRGESQVRGARVPVKQPKFGVLNSSKFRGAAFIFLFLTAATKANITRRLYEQLVWGCGDDPP